MNAVEILDELQKKAKHQERMRERFLKTRNVEDPL